MNKTICCVLLFMAALANAAEISVAERKRRGTYNAVAKQKVILRCVDQEGTPLPDVMVWSGVSLDGNPETTTQINGKTDTNGCFIVEGRSYGEVGYVCEKDGYYKTRETKWLAQNPMVTVSHDRWQPYGMTNTVVLKRKINPVAMYVATYGMESHNIPFVRKEIGFDLWKNDWIHPDGRGEHADFFVVFEWDGSKYADYKGSALTLLFKDPYSGAYKTEVDGFSALKSPYHANTNEVFAGNMRFNYIRGNSVATTVNEQLKGNECLILRVRTRVDDDGNLISAYYSKIYGPMHFGYALESPGSVGLRYYLNPNENDPNLEADITKNLLHPNKMFAEP